MSCGGSSEVSTDESKNESVCGNYEISHTLRKDQLENLSKSESLLKSLQSSELRRIITSLDSSNGDIVALQKHLHSNSDFAEFVEEMLSAIHYERQ